MIGKRRFIVIMTAMGLILAVELVNSGWSSMGMTALMGVVGTYFGFDMGDKIKNGQPGA